MDVRLPDGTVLQNVPDGMSKADLTAKLKANGYDVSTLEPAAVNAGRQINSIPRQLGLTARYGLEGVAGAAQLLTEPLRYATDRLTGQTGKTKPLSALASSLADTLGLPSPEGANERVVGDATRLLAGSGGMLGAANAAARLPGMVGQAATSLAANPLQQLASAGGAGGAGGASREAGGGTGMQAAAALLGGVGAGMVTSLAGAGMQAAKGAFNKLTPQQIDAQISTVLERAGVDYSQVPERVRQSMRAEMSGALQANKEVSPAAVARLLDFKSVGATPTRGMVSQNPVQITREMNLAKMAANSSDDALHGLPLIQNQNNATLIRNLNDLGANRGNTLAAGEQVTSSILGTQAGLRSAEQAIWDAAKASPGYKQPISSKVISDINGALGDEGMMPFMSPTISKYMEAFQTGQPFTPQAYRNLQSMLSRETRKGGNEGAAAGLAAQILRDSELAPAGFVNNGAPVTAGMAAGMRNADTASAEAINLVNSARGATRRAYDYEDLNPLVRSVLSEGASSDPQRIAQRFVIGGTANEAQDLVRQLGPNGLAPVKDAILTHLKSKALSQASDETGKFSQSAFNKALQDIGERKLSMLFTPEEITALRTNARVASLMQSQPVGSAVNNSNSGALLLGRGLDMLNKIPVIGPMTGPALKNVEISFRQRQAQNVLPGLLASQERQQMAQPYLLPAMAAGGLLSAPP